MPRADIQEWILGAVEWRIGQSGKQTASTAAFMATSVLTMLMRPGGALPSAGDTLSFLAQSSIPAGCGMDCQFTPRWRGDQLVPGGRAGQSHEISGMIGGVAQMTHRQ
jgi:hypothetical protein